MTLHMHPLQAKPDNILPVALIVSVILHLAGFALIIMHPALSQGPVFKEPIRVKLIDLPAGRGGVTEGKPGRTAHEAPPKLVQPPPQKNPKTTLPGKVTPPPKEGPSPVKTDHAGKAAGLGHAGAAGLGGKANGVILDEPSFQYAWYKARLEDLLKSNWRKPVLNNTKTVSASVHFTISSTGAALNVTLVNSSGIASFDQSVLRAVYNSSPFPKFPPQYNSPDLGVMYTFELLPEKK